MPFEEPLPRPFTMTSIRSYAPALPGLYGLSNAREWLYIGGSENIQYALLDHMNPADPAYTKQQPTGFVFEVCNRTEQAARQASLILEYKPSGNHNRAVHR